MVWGMSNFIHSFSCGYPVVSAPFIGEKNLFIPYWIVLELLSKKSGDHKCEGLLLDNWFCSTDLYMHPYAVCLDSYSFVVGFEFGKCASSNFFLLFQKCLAILGCISVWIIGSACQFLQNKKAGIWIGIALKFIFRLLIANV